MCWKGHTPVINGAYFSPRWSGIPGLFAIMHQIIHYIEGAFS
jgi:hypothetical protein